MTDILVTAGLRLMRASWAFFAISIVVPGCPGWINDVGMAVAAAGAWDLLVAWHSWRCGQAEAARRRAADERDLAMWRQALAAREPAWRMLPRSHVHEVGSRLAEGAWQGGLLVAMPDDEPCIICAEQAGYHDYGAY